MQLDTRFQDSFGVELPIIQAPMAGVAGSEIVVAVAQAGGLGSLPCASLSEARLRAEVSAIRRGTTKPINLNFFCHAVPTADVAREDAWRARLSGYYDELGLGLQSPNSAPIREPFGDRPCDLIVELRPEVVSFHFGLPSPSLLERVRASGAKILGSATSVEEARWLEGSGCDAVIAQGFEAGGHRGMFLSRDPSMQVGTMALVPQVVDAVKVPVIAAGGIADARGIVAAFALGASAVQLGTAYLLCPEATISPVHRNALLVATESDSVLTNVFTGRPARAIVNRLVRDVGPMSEDAPAFPLAAAAIAPLRSRSEQAGSGDFSPLWSGQAARLCRQLPAGELTRRLAAEMGALIASA